MLDSDLYKLVCGREMQLRRGSSDRQPRTEPRTPRQFKTDSRARATRYPAFDCGTQVRHYRQLSHTAPSSTMTRFEAQCPDPVRRPEASRRRSRRVARGSPREIRVVSGKGDPGRSIHPLRVRRPDDEMWVVFYRAPDYRTEKNHEKLTCRA